MTIAADSRMDANPKAGNAGPGSMPRMVRAALVATCAGGAALLAHATVTQGIAPAIALPFSIAGINPAVLGVALWILICLATSSASLAPQGRAAVVLAVGPLVAAGALGGPTAAGWVALLGTFELRELRGRVPWYGVLFNHWMSVVAYTSGAWLMALLREVSGADMGSLGGFLAIMVGAAASLAIATALTLPIVAARTGQPLSKLLPIRGRYLTGLFAGEASMAWLIASLYPSAWWAGFLFVLIDSTVAGSLARHRADWDLRHDQLTGLPNGRSLDDRIVELRRAPEPGLAVLYIDLDGFKAVNDTYDHLVGDDVLRITGERLAAACRQNDLLVRLHGDEFVVLASGLADQTEAEALASRLEAATEAPIAHEVGQLGISATVGIRMVSDPVEMAAALREADVLMSAGKDRKAAAEGRSRERR